MSGSDENELRYLCKELNISDFFKSISGSPTPKNILVERIFKKYGMKFMILMRVEMIKPKLLTLLKDSGCFRIFFSNIWDYNFIIYELY